MASVANYLTSAVNKERLNIKSNLKPRDQWVKPCIAHRKTLILMILCTVIIIFYFNIIVIPNNHEMSISSDIVFFSEKEINKIKE